MQKESVKEEGPIVAEEAPGLMEEGPRVVVVAALLLELVEKEEEVERSGKFGDSVCVKTELR